MELYAKKKNRYESTSPEIECIWIQINLPRTKAISIHNSLNTWIQGFEKMIDHVLQQSMKQLLVVT